MRPCKILVLDTSFDACAVALSGTGQTFVESVETVRQHNELILPMVESILKAANLEFNQLDAIAFGQGPGSFTGVRIATCVAQALAYVYKLPIVPVSSLATLALGVYKATGAKKIAVALDARMNSVYFGLYEVSELGCLDTLHETQVEATEVKLPDGEWLCAGEGWAVYPLNRGDKPYHAMKLTIDARDMLALAMHKLAEGKSLSADQAVPVYFTDKQWRKKTDP